MAPKRKKYFAFECHDPEKGINGQLTWTCLPQGYKNSPTIFDEALHEDLSMYRVNNPDITLLQYVDDHTKHTNQRGIKDKDPKSPTGSEEHGILGVCQESTAL